MSKREMMIEIKNAFCLVTSIKARTYYDAYKASSIAIDEPIDHYVLLYDQMKHRAPGLSHPQLYAILSTLFGESTTLYDEYKCSFGFPFRLKIFRKDKVVEYLLLVTDYKGGINFDFRKILLTLEEKNHYRDSHRLYDPIEDDFSRAEMSEFMTEFVYFLLRYRDHIIDDYNQEFYRTLDYCCIIYGFRDGQFFMERYHDSDELSGIFHVRGKVVNSLSVMARGRRSSAVGP